MGTTLPRTLTMLVLAAFVGACGGGSPADVYLQDPGALKRGKSIFVGTCGAYCHSFSPGLRDAPYLFDCTWIHGSSDNEVFTTIAGGVPSTRMMGFGEKLPEGDADIWRVVAFLRSQRPDC
jgi:cytochrome c oxidase cbb3-type subunit 3